MVGERLLNSSAAANEAFAQVLPQFVSPVGTDTGGDYDDLAFALPANAGAIYRPRKEAAAAERLGDVMRV